MTSPEFKTVFTSLRPARVVVLMNQADKDWQATCLRIIEFFSQTWGGGYSIIIPTDGDNISDVFWPILEAYDADYYYYYYRHGKDLRTNQPGKYEELLEHELNKYVETYGSESVEETRKQIDEALLSAPMDPEPSIELQQQIRKRVAPFHFEDHVIQHGVTIDPLPSFPLAHITAVLPNTKHPKYLEIYENAYGALCDLWLASVTGRATNKLITDLTRCEVYPHNLSSSEYDPVELLVKSGGTFRSVSGKDSASPFTMANVSLDSYRSIKGSAFRGPAIVIAGETIFDFCLYFALSKLRKPVVWLPQDWLRLQSESADPSRFSFNEFARKLDNLRLTINTSPKYIFTSTSLPESDLLSLMSDLDKSTYVRTGTFRADAEVSFSYEKYLKDPFRLYERDNVDRASSLVAREGAYIDLFSTPKPKSFADIDPREHRWITEITLPGHQLPRHPIIGDWVVRHSILSTSAARVGKWGISYLCPNVGYFGGDIDTALIRPNIFIPTAFEIFERVFNEIGYEARLSDKGFFAQDTISKFGGVDGVGLALRNKRTRDLLFKFLDHVPPQSGVHDEGEVLKDKRRYLNFPAIAGLIDNESASKAVIETLLSAEVLYRGFILKCRFCKNADWFAIDEVSQVFKCKRCGRTQQVSAENYWYGKNEPGWYYKLDEIVYQFLSHNGHVPVLALDCLRAKVDNSFLYTSDVDLIRSGSTNGKKEKELDILCICDGVITLGEAKKEDVLARTKKEEVQEIQKYYELAQGIGAGSIVFATFADSWSERTQTNISKIIVDRQIDVKLLGKSSLLAE